MVGTCLNQGGMFTAKLEGMFQDMDVSKDLSANFKKIYSGSVSMQFFVISSHWPTYNSVDIVLPPEMSKILDSFRDFYLGVQPKRKLTWLNQLSTCVLKASFPKVFLLLTQGDKELNVSLMQAVVLLLFNSFPCLTPPEIESQTGLSAKDVSRILASLSSGKLKLLSKDPDSKSIEKTDSFTINDAFSNPLFRLKVAGVIAEKQVESSIVIEKVITDRKFVIEAAIVRILKARRRIEHKALVQEVFEQCKFSVEVFFYLIQAGDIKGRIETLIDREYIARDVKEVGYYIYVA